MGSITSNISYTYGRRISTSACGMAITLKSNNHLTEIARKKKKTEPITPKPRKL